MEHYAKRHSLRLCGRQESFLQSLPCQVRPCLCRLIARQTIFHGNPVGDARVLHQTNCIVYYCICWIQRWVGTDLRVKESYWLKFVCVKCILSLYVIGGSFEPCVCPDCGSEPLLSHPGVALLHFFFQMWTTHDTELIFGFSGRVGFDFFVPNAIQVGMRHPNHPPSCGFPMKVHSPPYPHLLPRYSVPSYMHNTQPTCSHGILYPHTCIPPDRAVAASRGPHLVSRLLRHGTGRREAPCHLDAQFHAEQAGEAVQRRQVRCRPYYTFLFDFVLCCCWYVGFMIWPRSCQSLLRIV